MYTHSFSFKPDICLYIHSADQGCRNDFLRGGAKIKALFEIRRTFAANFVNIRRTRGTLFTKFAAHLPHIKQFKESAKLELFAKF